MLLRLPPSHLLPCSSGAGIPPGQGERLFKEFGQLNNKDKGKKLGAETAGQPQGTGLGLNLCLTFVQLMNGYIWASNNSGPGATFSFCLPLVSNEKKQLQSQSSSGDSSSPHKLGSPSSHVANYKVPLVDGKSLCLVLTGIAANVLDHSHSSVMLKRLYQIPLSIARCSNECCDALA